MEHLMVGYGFRPTEAELVGYYLRHKIHGNNWIVDESIKVVDICSFAPSDLPQQSVHKSTDRMWYFYCRRDATYGSKTKQTRQTSWGYWKLTGSAVEIKDLSGRWSPAPGTTIGYKRVLVFIPKIASDSNQSVSQQKSGSEWIIHEYHYSLVPELERKYVICRLEYKGNEIIYDNPTDHTAMTFIPNPTVGAVIDQSLQANYEASNTSLEGIPIPDDWFDENSSFDHMLQENSGFLHDPLMYNTLQIGENSNMQLPHQESDSTNYLPPSSGNYYNQEHPYGPGAHDDETHILHNFASQFQLPHNL